MLIYTKPLFAKFGILNIFDMYVKDVIIFMYKFKFNLLPKSFDECFVTNKDIHNYNTRNKDNFKTRISKTKTIFNTGTTIWNGLPNDIKNSKNLNQLKNKMKNYLRS